MENDFRKLVFIAMASVAIVMLLSFSNSHGAKEKTSDLLGVITNLDAMIAGAGTPDTVCVLFWKGRFKDGTLHTGTEHKTHQIRSVYSFSDEVYKKGATVLYWRDVCLDTAYGEWSLYQTSVQVWNKQKVATFNADVVNRYLIDTTDLTIAQINKIKQAGKGVQSLGNFRIKKEAK